MVVDGNGVIRNNKLDIRLRGVGDAPNAFGPVRAVELLKSL